MISQIIGKVSSAKIPYDLNLEKGSSACYRNWEKWKLLDECVHDKTAYDRNPKMWNGAESQVRKERERP